MGLCPCMIEILGQSCQPTQRIHFCVLNHIYVDSYTSRDYISSLNYALFGKEEAYFAIFRTFLPLFASCL